LAKAVHLAGVALRYTGDKTNRCDAVVQMAGNRSVEQLADEENAVMTSLQRSREGWALAQFRSKSH
jgi:hypothetical protein